ncbi:right-handed parallel beta-helix repeat-containing protein [Bradyrhizobium diazoefficiens]|nr:carbohydrate-binding domain-containing protein [Bradyrhizobium diazoefficiens]MBR0703702.1 right-handed parallel beta-helix repeat-containing protein [Bradyrhizobium diazoefficiens]MBR0772458.1 right-handed parallel beta-helix repeat-containing protein [Bradyrhizobium diazoefficiens]
MSDDQFSIRPIVYLTPTDDVQSIVDASSEGTLFILKSGLYHNITIEPKDFQSFVGEDGAVMSGAVEISNWSCTNGIWTASGFPAPSYSHGEGRDGMAQYVEDLFVDDKPYVRVANLADIKPGTFYYADGKVYISDDPTGKHTEASSTTTAFAGSTTRGVTIANITIEKYASMAQHGAIEGHNTQDWELVDVTARLNHGAGVAAGDGMKILGGVYSSNGQVGIHAWDTTDLVVDGVVASNNNYAGFLETWDAGGIKILTSNHVTIQNSHIFSNAGVGLWFDWDNKDAIIQNNWIERNDSAGLFYEASYSATISSNNISFNNKNGYTTGYWGADVHITNSSDVNVRDNYIVSDIGQGIGLEQTYRDPGAYGIHGTFNNTVSSNTIVMLTPGQNGFVTNGPENWGNIIWDENTYKSSDAKSLWYTWIDRGYWAQDRSHMPIEADGRFEYSAKVDVAAGFLKSGFTNFDISVPNVTPMSFHTTEDQAVTGSLDGIDQAGLMFSLMHEPAHGSLKLNEDGSFYYQPDAGFSGSDSFEFRSTNKYELSSTSVVTIDVVQDAPSEENAVDLGSGPDTVVLRVSGDSFDGDPTFSITIDGQKFEGLSTSASNRAGEWQDITLHGNFGNPKEISVEFLNDAWGGSETLDRNLYVHSLSVNGSLFDANTADTTAGWTNAEGAPLVTNGVVTFDTSSGPDTIVVRVSGDAYKGTPLFAVAVNDKTIYNFTTTASHSAGEWQDIVIHGNFGISSPVVSVAFQNDAWDGPGADRNLYVESVSVNGIVAEIANQGRAEQTTSGLLLAANGSVLFDLPESVASPTHIAATHFDVL